jgi:pyridoxine 4-dehydrogenase
VKLELAGFSLTRIGLGTNRLQQTPEHVAFIRDAVAAGVQMIDTAHLYTGGQSEAALGEALSPRPEGVLLATKGGYRSGKPEVLREELAASLEHLRAESVDLYYLHRADQDTPLEESLAAIKEFVAAGQVRHVGISEVGVEQIERARAVLPVAVVQNRYNLAERKWDAVVDHCTREGIPFVPFFPLRPEGPPALAEIARRHGATPAQVKLAWLLKRSPLMLPIPGTLSLEHLKENLGALELKLSEAEFAELT